MNDYDQYRHAGALSAANALDVLDDAAIALLAKVNQHARLFTDYLDSKGVPRPTAMGLLDGLIIAICFGEPTTDEQETA